MVEQETFHEPPQRMLRLLRWFCADHFLDEVEGDLYELYQDEVEIYGEAKARRRFHRLAIGYFRPYFFDRNHLTFSTLYTPDMIQHFLKVAFRQLQRQKFYAFINISGFALGLAACILIGLFLKHELSYDKFYPNANQLYRVTIAFNIDGRSGHSAVMSTPLAPRMKMDIPEVVDAVRLAPGMYDAGSNQVRRASEEANRYEEGFTYADSSFLEMFDFPLLRGERLVQLKEPRTMVITQRKAEAFFGRENPIGQTLVLNNREDRPYTITGVLADLPANTHFDFDYLISMSSSRASQRDNWGFNNFLAYVELAPNADPELVEKKTLALIRKHRPEFAELIDAGNQIAPYLQPVQDVHLYSSEMSGYWQHGNYQYVYLFAGVALFILLLAGINFVNLTTARSSLRALETGMRKVLGGLRQQLVVQFLLEAMLLSFLALLLAVLLAWVALPYFNELTDRQLTLPWDSAWWYATILGAALGVGLLVGLYPAVFLSAHQPLRVLKGYLSSGRSANRFRSQLVVFQFTVAVALIAGSLVVREQLYFLQNQELGFDKEQVLILEGSFILENPAVFKEQLEQLPAVQQVSMGGYIPVEGYFRNGCSTWETDKHTEAGEIPLEKWYVDHDYLPTLGMDVIAGRGFSREFATDSSAMILNETAVKEMGLEDPVGARLSSYTYLDPATGEIAHRDYTVIGVVRDFHFESLRSDIQGLSMVMGRGRANTLIKLDTENINASLEQIAGLWSGVAPGQPFRHQFLDEQYNRMYAFEQRAGTIVSIFTGLAIFIACLGLFALATFIAEQRRREIGVRKVLGASVWDIVYLLTKNFVVLISIAIIIAVPLAWWMTRYWLADFAYRVDVSWQTFAVAGSLAIILAITTMSYHALKAATTNPVNTIRNQWES